MARLRWHVALLTIWLLLFFNFERFILFADAAPIAFATSVYAVGALAALLPLSPFFERQRLIVVTIPTLALFGLALALDPAPDFGGVYTYLTCTELSFVLVTLFLAYRTSKALGEFRHAVEAVTLLHTDTQLRTRREAEERLELAMIGSRRSQHPLSLVLLHLNTADLNMALPRLIQEAQRTMMRRYTLATLARMLAPHLRRTDMIIEDRTPGRFLIVASDTPAEAAATLGQRAIGLIDKLAGIKATFGVAGFPEHAFTFEEMVNVAEKNLNEQTMLMPKIMPWTETKSLLQAEFSQENQELLATGRKTQQTWPQPNDNQVG